MSFGISEMETQLRPFYEADKMKLVVKQYHCVEFCQVTGRIYMGNVPLNSIWNSKA